jgi:RNA polymerase sigma-70 factor (ECF subfamily)
MPKPLPQVDTAVVVRARAGDRAAHAELYTVFAPSVFTIARRMLASKALAEDVLQETFIDVLRKIESYRGDAELGFWIRRIAINKCLMHLRSSWVSRRMPGGDERVALEPTRPAALDDRIALERALDELAGVARAVVWLHDVEGYTHKEIGTLMGASASFSKSQLARAHERLRVLLHGENETISDELCVQALKTC